MTTVAVHAGHRVSPVGADSTLFETIAEATFRHYARLWKAGTLAVNRSYLANQILPSFRGRPIAAITRADVQRWFASLHATPAAADRSLPILSAILRHAEIHGQRPEGGNPCLGIRRYRRRGRERFLTLDEYRRLGAALLATAPHGGGPARRPAARPAALFRTSDYSESTPCRCCMSPGGWRRPMSIERFFATSESRQRLRAGPLARAIDGFAAWLSVEGYARPSAREKLRFVETLSRWLEREELGVEDLDEQRIGAFLLAQGAGSGRRGEAVTGRQLLCYLRGGGVIPAAVPCPCSDTPIDRIEGIYERFLVNERGVSPATVTNYLPIVRAFLTEHFGSREVALGTLGVRDANQFVLRQARRLSRSRAKLVVTVLRSFLRHLYQRGDVPVDLSSAVVTVTHWRLSGLPKALAPEQVESLLDSCDRGTATGQRDYAVLLLLARLGLRAGEVVALTLDDFDWDEGIVTVHGKGNRRELLPLPREVGEGLTEYLRASRPVCQTRRLFVRMHAPHRGLRSAAAICGVVRRALTRAGIESSFKGAHLLRHSLATSMLRNGASLEDIGQILRHCHPETTQIYAKVDLDALRALAPAWPGGAA